MKRFFPALLALLVLSGCGAAEKAAPVPTVSEVAEQYTAAATLYDWFDKNSPSCIGDPVEVDGNTYRQVDVDGPKTYADLEAAVRSCFAPDLADRLLSESQNFRDIDGKLYCAEGGRGDNIYLYDKTVAVNRLNDDQFTVQLTFWTNISEPVMATPSGTDHPVPTHEATFGYSTETLHYQRTEDGYRFLNFCSSDGLELDADTIYTFNYITDFESGNYTDYTDWQLLCYLANSDGAASEGPDNVLLQRFLTRPQDILSQLALLYESPFYGNPEFPHMDSLVLSPAYSAASWLYPDEQPDFTAALDACTPETPAQQEVLDLLSSEFTALTADENPYDSDREFGLLLPGKPLVLTLGEQTGSFPWEFDLEGTPVELGSSDAFGTAYEVDCGTVKLQYSVKNGIETLYAMETSVPFQDSSGVYCTPRGLYCGYDEDHLQQTYRHAMKLPDFEHPDYDSCWVYEVLTKRIAAYCRDGVVCRLEIQNLIDGQLPG